MNTDARIRAEQAALRQTIATLRAEANSERARADRYLAAMAEWVDAGDAAFETARTALIRPEDEPPRDVVRGVENRVIRAENTVRRIVEEARRG